MMFSRDIFGRSRPRYASREEPEQLLRLSHTAWHAMLLMAFGSVVCAVLFGVYLLASSLGMLGSSPVSNVAPPSELLSTAELARTVRDLQERQALFDILKSSTSTATDPSR